MRPKVAPGVLFAWTFDRYAHLAHKCRLVGDWQYSILWIVSLRLKTRAGNVYR